MKGNLNEKNLFLKLCAFDDVNKAEVEELLESGCFSEEVIGTLFVNRMAPVAYGVLQKEGLTDKLSREFRNSLRDAKMIAEQRTQSFIRCIEIVTSVLEQANANYALLKGAYLCGVYPLGYRTSNDIDILVLPENITKISNALKGAGFEQGSIRNGEFVPATRKEIIESKMMRGETVPFIKQVDMPFMKHLEVDINFSLDYKNSDGKALARMLERADLISTAFGKIRTLDRYDFLIHLCAHLYKEATTLPWIKMKRDMTLYKYMDIYYLFKMLSEADEKALIARVAEYGVENELLYCIKSVSALFPIKCKILLEHLNQHDSEELDYVVAPMEKKIYMYAESDPAKRFFDQDRSKLLVEVRK